jgi:hypothetical protein
LRTVPFLCPKCGSTNCFRFDDNIKYLQDLNSNWFKCIHCLKISDTFEWQFVNKPIAKFQINPRFRKFN